MGGQPAHFYRGNRKLRYPDMRIKSSHKLLPAFELQRPHDHFPVDFLKVVNRRRVLYFATGRGLAVLSSLCAFEEVVNG